MGIEESHANQGALLLKLAALVGTHPPLGSSSRQFLNKHGKVKTAFGLGVFSGIWRKNTKQC